MMMDVKLVVSTMVGIAIAFGSSYFTITLQQTSTTAELVARIQSLESAVHELKVSQFSQKDAKNLETLLTSAIELEATKSHTDTVRLSSETNLLVSELRRRITQLEQITSLARDGQQLDLDGVDQITRTAPRN